MDNNSTLGLAGLPARMKQIREKLHYTQDRLGNHLQISGKAIGAYERGKRTPELGTLVKLAEMGGVSLDWLIKGEEYVQETPTENGHPVLSVSEMCLALIQLSHLYEIRFEENLQNGHRVRDPTLTGTIAPSGAIDERSREYRLYISQLMLTISAVSRVNSPHDKALLKELLYVYVDAGYMAKLDNLQRKEILDAMTRHLEFSSRVPPDIY